MRLIFRCQPSFLCLTFRDKCKVLTGYYLGVRSEFVHLFHACSLLFSPLPHRFVSLCSLSVRHFVDS